jgi:transposase
MPLPRYPSDLSDEEWIILQPLLASPEKRGRPPKWPARRVADAVFYLLRSGCAWRMLPKEYPPWQRPSTTTSADGGVTAGSGELTTGYERRCAGRKGTTETPARV